VFKEMARGSLWSPVDAGGTAGCAGENHRKEIAKQPGTLPDPWKIEMSAMAEAYPSQNK